MSSTPSTSRIALVTGAGTGIGKTTAHALLAAGWTVVFNGRRPEPLAASIAESPHAARAWAWPADVGDAAAVAAMFDEIRQRHGRLDLLFNNAGVFTAGLPIDELPVEAWQRAVDSNLTGVFLCTREAFRLMKAQSPRGGRIINNGSISAHTPRPDSVAYTATKHAITGLTKSCALDGRAFDIAVGQIDIGNAATDMTTAMQRGMAQPDGSVRTEARMEARHVADAIVQMASLPLSVNVLFQTIMATQMPYVGRG